MQLLTQSGVKGSVGICAHDESRVEAFQRNTGRMWVPEAWHDTSSDGWLGLGAEEGRGKLR